jgi:nicotinamidase-related amidase
MPTQPERLRALVGPDHTVVLTMELQKGVVGDQAILPTLPVAVREVGLLEVAGRVCNAARSAGVRVIHATVEQRADGVGQPVNSKIVALLAKQRAQTGSAPTDIGQPGVALVDELAEQPQDVKVARMHGMTPFTGTELDAVIRSLGATTIVLVGVSLNLGILGAALSGLDLGYQVVIVRDAVVGVPREYGEAVLQNSLAMIATIVDAGELLAVWAATAD